MAISEESNGAAVFVARSKLDGVLQTLVDQKEDGGAISPGKESNVPADTDSDHFELVNSPISSPAKKSPRVNRLQRKRKLVKEEVTPTDFQTNSNACLLKLFDRTVDIASFNEHTPLYPICRAWIRNNLSINNNNNINNNNIADKNPNVDPFESEMTDAQHVYELPGPVMMKSEDGETNYPTIPSPVKEPRESFYINQDASAIIPEDIFLNHMRRWKHIRQKWKKASRENEARYIESYKILQEMFDKQNA
ncbi:hypothetical protein HELRODRAFT_182898 [Helobdella robusta]|uniref:Lin-37 DREAM MuvB core complex component n=1 Tax=Helobdella robusta TaxID=6412 RepID=T1FIW7_HELRO|nr:hypothetical protein HELRODRAFT_182898 [Helobdella robusta]ESN89996.1 hypothetical protein HELRODRAFT_182898 [Helobdella robusta]